MANAWVNWIPDKVGFYWCFGSPHESKNGDKKQILPNKLQVVEVKQTGKTLTFICGGAFVYPKNGYPCLWKEMEIPPIPENW